MDSAVPSPSPSPALPAPAFNTEPAAIFWLTWGGLWTIMVICGMAFLYVNRNMPFLRIRGLALSFASVTLLHLYWFSCQAGLSYGSLMPDSAEFWVMSLYLPFGIALFHASNSRFLHIAKAQRKYAGKPASLPQADTNACSCKDKTLVGRFRKLDYTTKMLAIVCTGMVLQGGWFSSQLLLTVVMYLISRKYHPSFGIPGTEVKGTPAERKIEMARGWEWWPSVFWQFFWAWVVAPIILWKSRGIKDTQGWRFQTISCCIANLHATPMWLVALYVPAMAPVNKYFIPPQWICLSIFFTEIFAIFIPCWQVIKHNTLRQETLESIAIWEAKNQRKRKNSILTGSTQIASSATSSWKSVTHLESGTGQAESIFTMGALEYVLDKNPEPLRKFSALRDFSGENIAFLSAVGEWKSSIPQSSGGREQSPELTRERFNRALRIYTEFISPRHAEFQINIASQDLKRLESIFDDATRILYGHQTEKFSDPVVPFEDPNWAAGSDLTPGESEKAVLSQEATMRDPIHNHALYWGDIPEAFTASVFDDAETSIKYLVLTNTWPKFVKERRYSADSEDSGATMETYNSTSTLNRVVRYFRAIRM
ncbi:uncharacterized protein CTRU02_209456 [Colletotrichum truncatum]|uniref:Uncharacterized protein n=1 Tax=Colletotrichum truncatum TaxID=5467 RepID=A0ACC3YSF7_COLTU|nr:uncharacterized protein CTRU02_08467 [Colletotrichum truncatum]KAF6789768.1 hypothetical protein CTRU02_08467 [Colletotrichum truncatum]